MTGGYAENKCILNYNLLHGNGSHACLAARKKPSAAFGNPPTLSKDLTLLFSEQAEHNRRQ